MSKLKVSFLNVGHGDFAYIETPLGDNLIIDIGSGDVVPSEFLSKVPVISELQISHPHTDHFDDIIDISKKNIKSFRCPDLERFSNEVIGWTNLDQAKIAKLRELKKRIPKNDAAVNDGNGFSCNVWSPGEIDYRDPNTASLVTILTYSGVKFLFGGDLPASGWENLLEDPRFVSSISGTTIFKVPHHGRKEGCCQALFDLGSDIFYPKLCVISDKSIDESNKNTVMTSWYTSRTKGCNVEKYEGQRSVMTTRSDESISIVVDSETRTWRVYPHTNWV
jgi:beta-lactamase superfamily II metal-dependent hydrolase